MSIRATSPFPIYLDNDGTPLSQGYVYFGVSGANPETVPQTVYWDEVMTIPAAQPLRTISGFLVRNGSPASVYLANVYSMTVRNKNRVLLYSSLTNVGIPSSTAMIPVTSAATLALARDALGVSKKIKGYQAISISHLTDTAEPEITAGSEIEVNGTFYEFPIDEAAVAGGWAALAVSSLVYMYVVPAGALHTWIYSATAPTWDTAKQGWYNGANRCFGMLYKDAASLYQFKNLIPAIEAPLTFIARISSTVNPFVFNLPVSTGEGMRVMVVDTAVLATGLVKIDPNGTDDIGATGAGVACYLQNLDQSTFVYRYQFLDLVDSAAGYWTVVGGQFCPEQAVDAAGTQYHLGKLHHLPLGNATDRTLANALVVPASGNWYASAITGSGIKGIPGGAKGIRARVILNAYPTAAGLVNLIVIISDNNSNLAPAAPEISVINYANASGATGTLQNRTELDIPLNSAGQFYFYDSLTFNCTAGSSTFSVIAVGFYMGD